MFAKLRARVLYPEIFYCAWLGILPALMLGMVVNAGLAELLGAIGWYETLTFYACAVFYPGTLGILIGALAQIGRRYTDYHWIQLSFLVPFLTVVIYFLFDANWNLCSLFGDEFFVILIFELSLCSSVIAILIRTFLNRTKPMLSPALAEFAP